MRTTLMLTALSLALVVPLHGQEAGTSGQASADARISASLDAAVQAGIPADLIESKIEEGRAKQVPMERIAAAVEARLDALLDAQDALTRASVESVTSGDLSVAADALQAGVSEEALIEIQTSAPRERRAVATAVLSGLVQLGDGSETALARVQAALGAGPEALADLRARTAARLRLEGIIPPVGLDAAAGLSGVIGSGG